MARLTQKMSKSLTIKDDYRIELITEEDTKEVLDFLKRFFFKDEPLNTAIELGECPELEVYSLKSLPEKSSFKAVNSEKKIIGVLINGLIKKAPPTATPAKLADGCKHEKFRKILSLMDYIDSKFDIYDLYPNAEAILDGKILSVDTAYRGLGIAGKLIERTIDYMKQHKIPVFNVLCTSHFSARVLEKLDFHEVYKLPYSEYVNEDGKQLLNPALPHVAARILVKEI